MSFKDNQDLRPRAAGGWAYAEHELWSVFAPIIGPDGVAVYMAFCRLVPLAAINIDRQISVRTVSEYSCVGRSKCAEMMQMVFKLGMVIETKYLDGRTPTYKLPSLAEAARVGQKELLRRAGVRDTDTAPFDQAAKHEREKVLRAQKRRSTSSEEQQSKELPLYPAESTAETADGEGVRVADTHQQGSEPEDSSDAVSAKNVTVSAETVHVSANPVTVSANREQTRGPLTTEENRSEVKSPLPPAAQGEVGFDDPNEARPSLPSPGCTIADAGFDAGLPIAARWVMADCGVTKRRIEPLIVEQLRLHCKRSRSVTLEDAAALMATQWRVLHDDADLLRHRPWKFENFIAGGHWARPLPYDAARVPAPSMPAPAPSDDRFAPESVARWIEGNAAALEAMLAGWEGVERVRAIAQRVRQGESWKDTDKALSAIDDELLERAMRSLTEAQMVELKKQAAIGVGPYRPRMNAEQLRRTEAQFIERGARELSGFPRLPLFFMPLQE